MPQPPRHDPGPRRPGSTRPQRGEPGPYPGLRGRERAVRRPQPRPGAGPRWWGSRPGRLGVAIVIGSAALGALITALARSGPGFVLGLFLVAGTAAAALAVQPRAVYRVIPVPALAYLAAAILAGLIGDRAASTSHTALAVSAAQWIAGGFRPMTAATALAIAVTAVRWPRTRHGSHDGPRRTLPAAQAGAAPSTPPRPRTPRRARPPA